MFGAVVEAASSPDADTIRPFTELAPKAPDLAFSLEVPARRRGIALKHAVPVFVLVAAALFGYGYYSSRVVSTSTRLPAAPEMPLRFTPRPVGTIATPTPAEADAWIDEMRRIVAAPPLLPLQVTGRTGR